MTYRPEIDGLRAIAVLAVILFHAGFSWFPGGYVGVDVFFVISGYLITSIIRADLEAGRFSFARFYERRARRILPALILVIVACAPFAWLWMLPGQFREFGGSAFSVGVFLSNFFFLSQLEYFQPSSELQPLLHTWSLSIEEQYYLIFPAAMLGLWRFGARTCAVAIAAFVVLGIWLVHVGVTDDASKNYFHSAARLWEIGAGALCAFLPRVTRVPGLGLAGLALILWAVLGFTPETPFPSLWTLLPVGGAMLVILAGNAERGLGPLLSNPLAVGVGLISYSAYLWHQPLFAFARLRSLTEPDTPLLLGLVALTFGLAWLSWRFVETPFRHGKHRVLIPARGRYMLTSLGLMALVSASGLAIYLADGLPDRTLNGVSLAGLEERLRPNHGLSIECEGYQTGPECRTSESPNVLVWGDSFAMHIVPGLIEAFPGLEMQQQTRSGCAPLAGVSLLAPSQSLSSAEECQAFTAQVLDDLTKADRYLTVIMSSPLNIHDRTVWRNSGERIAPQDAVPEVTRDLIATIERIRAAGHRVIVVSPPPETGADLGQCVSRLLRFGADETSCDFAPEDRINGAAYEILGNLPKDIPVLRLDTAICPGAVCDVLRDGVIIYRDKGHLSVEGAKALAPAFATLPLQR